MKENIKKSILEYDFPRDLKEMDEKELSLLTYSIRDFLLDSVSKTGGHLASNLGVVELTIALHKVFDSPKDKIIWDVGHQSYVHKILTGRAKDFPSLRQLDGLSGFPKTGESPCDSFNTGHSSTSISAAAGMAAARDLKGEKHEVIAVIGDGSLTGGMAYEALNNIGASKSKVIVVLNDNGMSISPNIGGISKHLDSLRTSKGYLGAKKFIKNRIAAIPSVGKGIANSLAELKNDIKYSMMDYGGVLFEELGFTYFGPVDGHDIAKLCDAFNRAKMLDEPVIIHVITKKGKGYRNAEKAPDKFHGIAPFDPETGELLVKPQRPTYSALMGEHLASLAREDERIVAITAAMGDATGLSKFAKEFPDRFFDVGIAEQHAVTFAAGLAKEGFRPFVCIYSSFLQRAYDQILHDVCMQNLPVTFMIDRAGIVGADGETHNGVFDLSYLNPMPNMTILAPTCDKVLDECMDYALELETPCAIRYPRGEAQAQAENHAAGRKFVSPWKKAKKVKLIGIGRMEKTARKTREILESKGITASCEETAFVKPIEKRLYENIESVNLIVTIEDNVVAGGFGEALAAKLGEDMRILNFGWQDKFIEQGTFEELTDRYGLSPEKIAERICEALERKA